MWPHQQFKEHWVHLRHQFLFIVCVLLVGRRSLGELVSLNSSEGAKAVEARRIHLGGPVRHSLKQVMWVELDIYAWLNLCMYVYPLSSFSLPPSLLPPSLPPSLPHSSVKVLREVNDDAFTRDSIDYSDLLDTSYEREEDKKKKLVLHH